MSKDWKDKLGEKYNVQNSGSKSGNPQKTTSTDFEKIQFYSDVEKGTVDVKLLTTKAQEWANIFVDKKLTSAQLRRFYHDAKKLEEQIKEKDFEQFKPHIKLLDSKVAYAYRGGGKDSKVPLEFRNFIRNMIYSIESKRDFEAFMLCFEAVVGYFYGNQKSK